MKDPDGKELKIVFAPGAFDHFEGTQDELDELMAEIKTMFENLTPEELEQRSRPLTEDEFDKLPEDVQEQLARELLPPEDQPPKRNLQ